MRSGLFTVLGMQVQELIRGFEDQGPFGGFRFIRYLGCRAD